MFEGNVEERNRLCRNGEALSAAVAAHAGWELVNEGAGLKQKWGFVSHTPGAELVIELNTTRETRPEEPRMSVQLAYLKSYSGMGAAAVRCANGCECDESVVDAHHSLQQSTIYLLRLRPTQAARCQVRIKVLARSTSGGHKFKVSFVQAVWASGGLGPGLLGVAGDGRRGKNTQPNLSPCRHAAHAAPRPSPSTSARSCAAPARPPFSRSGRSVHRKGSCSSHCS
jgi:hypothetical protein